MNTKHVAENGFMRFLQSFEQAVKEGYTLSDHRDHAPIVHYTGLCEVVLVKEEEKATEAEKKPAGRPRKEQ